MRSTPLFLQLACNREARVSEDEPCVLPVAADAADLTRAEEIRLRYAAIVESSDDAIIAKTLDAGRIVGCSKIARDITKAKQAEVALRQSEQRLARGWRAPKRSSRSARA